MIDLQKLNIKDKVKLFKKLYQDISGKGIRGDTELAHINSEEAQLLKLHGGAGTINEETGLKQYFGGGGSGGGGGQPANTTQMQTVREAPEIEARKIALYDQAASLASQPVSLPAIQVAAPTQLQQQGFGQAQQLAQQNILNQLQLGQSQLGLGQAGQGFLGSQISGLTALGTQQQAQRQAELEAQKQLEFQRIYQPLQTAQQYGQGVMGLISGYPSQTQLQSTPSPSPLQTLLGTGATLAGIYRALGQGTAGFMGGK